MGNVYFNSDLNHWLRLLVCTLRANHKKVPATLNIPGENLLRTFTDPARSSKFLLRSSRILHFLAKIFKDPRSSCQDLQESFIFLPRSLRIFKVLLKILEDPQGSWQECQWSVKILARKWKIAEDLGKNVIEPSKFW